MTLPENEQVRKWSRGKKTCSRSRKSQGKEIEIN